MPIKSRFQVPIPDISLPSCLFVSPYFPLNDSKPVFLDAENPSRSLTLNDYRSWSQRFAAGLIKHGLQKGDRVMIFSPNHLFFPIAFMGIIMAGGIYTGANPGYTTRELAHQIRDGDPVYILCFPANLDVVLEAAKEIEVPKNKIFLFDDAIYSGSQVKPQQGCEYWSTLVVSPSEGLEYSWPACSTPEESSQIICLNYSSGTTGLAKGVEITHKNYVANALQVVHQLTLRPDAVMHRQSARFLCCLPLFHAMAQTHFTMVGPMQGIPSYIVPKFDFENMLDYVQKYRITELFLVPPVLVGMSKHPQVRAGRWDLSSVNSVISGAAPLGKETITDFESLWGGKIHVRQGWGLTEATCTVTLTDPRITEPNYTVGHLVGNAEAKIMNEEGTAEVPRGERGEIWVRSPTIMKGYWRNEKATKETLTSDGWLRTGDIVHLAEDGQIYVVDRKKELIKVKGFQVAPAELEALLLGHPAIADAAVIGIPKDGDEAPRAYIALKSGQKASAEDIVTFVDERVSKAKRITGGVRFVDAIPKNPSGKILRKILRERAKMEESKDARAKL